MVRLLYSICGLEKNLLVCLLLKRPPEIEILGAIGPETDFALGSDRKKRKEKDTELRR